MMNFSNYPSDSILLAQVILTSLLFFLAAVMPWIGRHSVAAWVRFDPPDETPDSAPPLPPALVVALLLAFAGSAVPVWAAMRFLLNCSLSGCSQPIHAFLTQNIPLMPGLPSMRWEVWLDPLAAFFLILVGGFAAGVSIYSLGALRARHFRPQAAAIVSAFCVFAWSTLMAVLANDVFSLITSLEVMTLSFAFLSLYKDRLYQNDGEHHDWEKLKNARIAPQVYLMISHVSTIFLLLAFMLLSIPPAPSHTTDNATQSPQIEQPTNLGSFSFEAFRSTKSNLPPLLASIVFLLALAGLGIRAGFTPAHVWVSLVHPNSPTVTHAFSLGIAIKISIYLMFRIFFEFLVPQPWWGILVMLLAVSTALVNVWYAIAAHDLKTALAGHSVENIGLLAVALGAALLFFSYKDGSNKDVYLWLAALGLTASLYHILNHAVFKGLLYLSTGAIDNLTSQTVEFDRLGGLLKRYRLTALWFLIGSLSIAGFPPFNGFISEWMILQSLLSGMRGLVPLSLSDPPINVFLVVLSLALLSAAFALTAVCFFKIAGVTLLGEPRTPEAERSTPGRRWAAPGKDVPASMGVVMAAFAALCLALGLLPGIVIRFVLFPVAVSLLGAGNWQHIYDAQVYPALPQLPAWVMIGMAAVGLVYGLIFLLFGRHSRPHRPLEQWNCGSEYTPDMQPSAETLTFLIQDTFRSLARPTGHVTELDGKKVFVRPDGRKTRPVLPYVMSARVLERFRLNFSQIWEWLTDFAARQSGKIHTGDIRQSFKYILIVNILAMILFLIIAGK
jgi:hydrogenase-4 component B